jgi:hypothetical protein
MFCPDCDANLDDVPVGDPCPACGGARRSAIAYTETARAVATVGEVSLKITRGDHRPWTEKWLTILGCLDSLRAAYSGDARTLGNVEIDRRAQTFFVECDHLRDWLKADVAALGGASTADVHGHFQSSTPLQVCNAICVTHKHHTPLAGKTVARIRDTDVTPTGARVSIEIDWATPQATTVDALDLAEDCLASWRAFFSKFGIAEP